MSLPVAPNITADLFRGFDAGSPYPDPGRAPDVRGVPGRLRSGLGVGRLGFQARNLSYTHSVWLPAGTDVRDGYAAQVGVWDATKADTLCVADWPNPGWCTAFLVVLVQRARGGDYLVAYLDRLRSKPGKCGLGSPCGGCGSTPANWRLSVQGITSGLCDRGADLNGDWLLKPDPITACQWKTDAVVGCTGILTGVAWLLTGPYPPAPQNAWNLYALGAGMAHDAGGRSIPTYRCDPAHFNCNGANLFVLNPAGIATCGGQSASCCGNWPATLTITPA